MTQKKKIALIGGGNIGGTLAHLAALKNIGDIVILDRNDDYAKGKALDLEHTLPIEGIDVRITGSSDYKEIEGSDVVIVTAGVPRKEGMTRNDLLSVNAEAMKMVGEGIKNYAKDAFVVVVTNPLDAMVYALQKFSKVPHHKIVGMAGVLDSARFKLFLARELNVSVKDISSFVLGGHGDDMVPLVRYTTIGSVPLSEFIQMGRISEQRVEEILDRTRKGGGEIIKLLQKASAYYAPASSALEMAMSYLDDKRKVLPCAAHLTGQYGYENIYAGVPVIIGKNGVESVIELKLTPKEKEAFDKSVKAVKESIEDLEKLI